LTAVGLLEIVGSLLGAPLLLALGSLSGVAPLPRVFSRQQGIETYARRATVELHTVDGRTHPIQIDRSFGRRVPGPAVRVVAYAQAALFAGLDASARRDALLERAFCDPGDVARSLGIDVPVTRLRVVNWSALANDEPLGGVELVCRTPAR
jgi:hypothetical protein